MNKYYITQEAWVKLFDFFKGFAGIYIKSESKLRCFMESIFWIARTGAQWRELPSHYGKWSSVHKRFMRWTEKNVWGALLAYFSSNCDKESVMLDGSNIRAHACSSGYEKDGNENQALGRSKGG